MTPVSFSWDTRKEQVSFKWDAFFELELERGRVSKKILGIPIPFGLKRGEMHLPFRRAHLRTILSFLRAWKVKKIEGSLSFPDPMVNGILYGFLGAQAGPDQEDRKFDVEINFLGENWCRGEMVISPWAFFDALKKWILA